MKYSIHKSLKVLLLLILSLCLVFLTKIHSQQSHSTLFSSSETSVEVNTQKSTPKVKLNDGLVTLGLPGKMYQGKVQNGTAGHKPLPDHTRKLEKTTPKVQLNHGVKAIGLPDWMYWGEVKNRTEGHKPPPYHIGVLSSYKYLKSRANDVCQTWGQEAQSMAFYIGYTAQAPSTNLPVTVLIDVKDTDYPPQQKGFRMLQYWCKNLLDQYSWFVKVDDDCYVKVAHLEQFLTGLNETVEYYIGRNGYGCMRERPLLGLYGNKFCGGPTVVYSKAMLKGVCKYLETCLKEVVTNHEDTEIARCMISKTGWQCSESHSNIGLDKLFFHTYNRQFYKGDQSNNTKFTHAISVHAVRPSKDMFNLHFYYHQTLDSLNNTIPQCQPKSNPLGIHPLKALFSEEMCKKAKCIENIN